MSTVPAIPLSGDGGHVRARFDISYDGTEFSGWARQPGLRTVCGVLEDGLSTVLRVPVALTVAGRTDAGVHADGQVAHADVPAAVLGQEPQRLVRRLGRLLPVDVRVTAVSVVPAEFDARFGALRRHYTYRLTTAAHGADPLRSRDTVAWPRQVDLTPMRAAARVLLGEHDFVAFCRRREGASTVRELQRLDLEQPGTDLLVVRVTADAFCHSMVRSLVGALMAVGEGRRSVDWVAGLLWAQQRCSSVPVAPAHGLSLTGVDYPPAAELAARVLRTRAVRGPVTPLVRRAPRTAPGGSVAAADRAEQGRLQSGGDQAQR